MKKIPGLLLLLAVITALSCNKDDKPAQPPAPVITGIWPESGTANTIVTISGKYFSGIRTENTVTFNGKAAIVIEAAATELQVVSPEEGATGSIAVTVNNQSVTGPVYTYTAPPEEYLVSTFAGDGTAGSVEGAGSSARFKSPEGVAIDAAGNLIVVDRGNNRIRKITPAGQVSAVAGLDAAGYRDGDAAAAQFRLPWKSAVDAQGNILVADRDNHCIRKITPAGQVSTIAGTPGTAGFADGAAGSARFNQPLDIAVDAGGNIYVADNLNHRIRKITPAGEVSTLAGDGTAGYADGAGAAARFKNPSGLALDAAGNIIVADRLNHRIRQLTPAGVATTIAGSGTAGFADGAATEARFSDPYGITQDHKGNIIVADLNNAKIRKITADGTVSTIAGTSAGFADGPGISARFSSPTDVCVDADDNIYVAEVGNHRIRKIKVKK